MSETVSAEEVQPDEPQQPEQSSTPAEGPSGDLTIDTLRQILAGLAVGVPVEGADAVRADEGLAPDLAGELVEILESGRPTGDQARAIGDLLRARSQERNPLINECYRAAFYLGDDWQAEARNPLFARFTANKGGQPFDKWVHYFDIYARTLAPYVGKPVRVLEIGVFHGGGLDQLRALLGDDAVLVGADIDSAAKAACAGRFDVAVGDQTDPEFLASVVRDYGPFDVIIDDGGHTMAQQLASIEHLFPTLNEGGVYLVEDCHTSYWPEYLDAEPTFMNWTKDRLDDLNAYHFSHTRDLDLWTTDVAGIHVYDSVVVFDKKRRFAPFCEVAGTGSSFQNYRIDELTLLAYRAAIDVRSAELHRSQMAQQAAQRGQQEALAAAKEAAVSKELVEVALYKTHETVKGMRASRSWRITAPMRAVLRKMGRGGEE